MANRDFNMPIKGFSDSLSPDKQIPLTTGHMNNIYPYGALDNKIRLIQRPGLGNTFAYQISGVASPIVVILSVTAII
jgi:hypothetical protein